MKNIKEIFQGPKMTTYSIALLGVLMALRLVVGRFATITLSRDLHISLAFVVTVMIAYYFGPLWTAGVNGILNLLVFFIFPTGSPFFIGYTLSAVVGGLIYGLFFYPQRVSILRAIIAVSLVTIVVNLWMNALWSHLLYNNPFWFVFSARLGKEAIQLVPQIIISYLVLKVISRLKIESKLR
ncbi:folate family ECF transporter S component [Xylocopilactobacillus apicola]|uniref:Membrane protein n=1 Tax=Xylocopilactobacillus apicola TaxID=2932184 RepID=A0AAU9CXP2_9LACO|nr:folate family ECF transporter S component [Xylocopilactobacillus apicola]BDR58769.1 membrane protein [Xylocopilactobacillus apicola]